MNHETAHILLVDDEPNILKSLGRILKNHSITIANSGAEALAQALAINFDIVISDYRMPEMDGITFLEKFMAMQPDAIRIIVTGYADLEAAQNAINTLGVFRFINKPWNNLEIINAVEKGLELKRILQENKALADQVRQQQARLNEQEAIIKALEAEEPGITKVNWAPDGSIILDESELDDDIKF
ncbi:response regulator [Methylomonas sp. SURF-2]|uniref:Response regulator n=1 Tax=Methylomonas subterranea TaxID=2952225 RepID=A0ABT1TJS7_9GAMM|nr:response regulator [Methylomonas sp. SURF-2]MCQ8105718.1 response regulator [Methylomonas sp. SURF-2]